MRHNRSDYERIQDPDGIIPEEEPVFLLRGQDVSAAETVRYWADINEMAGGDPEASAAARRHAILMDMWPVKKRADLISAVNPFE